MHLNIFDTLPPSKVIDVDGKFIPLDLSVENPAILHLLGSADYEIYIQNFLHHNKASAAYGGYNEQRNLYKRSNIFADSSSGERDIHIGMDIWTNAGTPVKAAMGGTIHSFNNNIGVGNYGPTIILEHDIAGEWFYTLYGHLSQKSIEGIAVGHNVKHGQTIGTLGTPSENGDYAPHLHFQVIMDIEDYSGDYPGVCSKEDRNYFLKNCPDPNLILKLK